MNCKECGYWYADETMNGGQPCCWWIPRAPGEVAPCDEEEEYIPNDYYGDECDGICDLCSEGDTCALR